MIDTFIDSKEFEQKPHREVEQKLLPLYPQKLAELRAEAVPIEQFYLSHPNEDFSLRLRETVDENGEPCYTAALKDRGEITASGLERFEVETPITPEMYEFYKTAEVPVLRKLRAEPAKNIVVDFFEDGHIHAESENPISWKVFCERQGHEDQFIDVTGDRVVDNEWRAHFGFRREHGGAEALTPRDNLDVKTLTHEILRAHSMSSTVIVRIGGRSGSGKTTIVKELQTGLQEYALESTVLSTDNYHRGKTWLDAHKGSPWTDWDAAIVYDTAALAADLARIQLGGNIEGRRFDFETQEPVSTGPIQPVPVIIIEGIYARSPDLEASAHLAYEMPTPLATCIGRRLLRDMNERPQFADPVGSLRYMLEQAEPAYREQEKMVP